MKITKLIILLCCMHRSIASHSHTIPVEKYSTELQDLGQHVVYKEAPLRVIKITKTVAVKVPVPYPVKVVEKVPYPVHVAKPYPVPVPQIVHVPQAGPAPPAHHSYNVHENAPTDYSPQPHDYYAGQDKSHALAADEASADYGGGTQGYDAPTGGSFYGHADKDGGGSAESKAYDEAFKQFLQKNSDSSSVGVGAHQYY